MTSCVADVKELEIHVDDQAFFMVAEVVELDASAELADARVMLCEVRELEATGSLET